MFCEDLPPELALGKPFPQSRTDQEYDRRDLVLRNNAIEGFWAETRQHYDAEGVIVDAKNYGKEINRNAVHDFSRYLKEYGLGRFGIIAAREVSPQTQASTSQHERVQSAIDEQKNQWRNSPHKMIILLGEADLVEMLETKAGGKDPTALLRDRMFTLKSRM